MPYHQRSLGLCTLLNRRTRRTRRTTHISQRSKVEDDPRKHGIFRQHPDKTIAILPRRVQPQLCLLDRNHLERTSKQVERRPTSWTRLSLQHLRGRSTNSGTGRTHRRTTTSYTKNTSSIYRRRVRRERAIGQYR